jgi:M61 glycyl aminopeptidase
MVASASPPTARLALPTATLRLTTVCERGSGEPSALDVALSLSPDDADPAKPPVFLLEDRVFGSSGMAKLISAEEATDERGPIPLDRRVATDPESGEFLEIKASRAPVGSITLRYRACSVPAAERGARQGLRHDSTGIGGLGAYFLALPDSNHPHRIRVEWGLPACAPGPEIEIEIEIELERLGGMQALSTFGAGPGPVETTGMLSKLRMASYFVGRPTMVTVDRGSLHVRSAWFGAPSFDPIDAGTWAARAYAAERAFFADEDPAPYQIFVRVLPAMRDRSNGMGQLSSFLSAIGPATSFGPGLRTNMAHEMMHRWLGLGLRLAGPDGSNFWFTEGFTVHYARALMLRAGLISPEEFLSELKGATTRYFSNEHASASNEEIRRGFFDDDALSVVPYTRGALYAAELDAAIRRASGGARSLDDVMRELYRLSLSSERAPENELGLRELPQSTFREAVSRELGPPGVARFEAVILRGERPEPPSEAFGPCFKREARSTALFQIGFDEKKSLAEPMAVRGLIAGSAAAKAGLVEGDEILSLESSPLFPEKEAVATIRRGGKRVVLRYLPARPGPKREGFEWVRVKGVPDDRCREPTASIKP